jgi:hypothetical protein
LLCAAPLYTEQGEGESTINTDQERSKQGYVGEEGHCVPGEPLPTSQEAQKKGESEDDPAQPMRVGVENIRQRGRGEPVVQNRASRTP